jgi:hypothetical protein
MKSRVDIVFFAPAPLQAEMKRLRRKEPPPLSALMRDLPVLGKASKNRRAYGIFRISAGDVYKNID